MPAIHDESSGRFDEHRERLLDEVERRETKYNQALMSSVSYLNFSTDMKWRRQARRAIQTMGPAAAARVAHIGAVPRRGKLDTMEDGIGDQLSPPV